MASNITDKIAKLLAMAEGTNNPAEAEAFTEKAEELMLQYGIQQAQVQAARPGDKREEIIIRRIRVTGPYRMALSGYGYCVAPAFNIKGYKSVISGKEEDIWLVGHQSDVEQAETLVRSLLIQSDNALKYWWKNGGRAANPAYNTMNQYLAKREFMFAFGSGVRDRLQEVRNRVVHEAGPGTELVLVDRTQLVTDWEKNNMRFSKSKSSSLKGGTMNARQAGFEAGRDAVGQRKVTT